MFSCFSWTNRVFQVKPISLIAAFNFSIVVGELSSDIVVFLFYVGRNFLKARENAILP